MRIYKGTNRGKEDLIGTIEDDSVFDGKGSLVCTIVGNTLYHEKSRLPQYAICTLDNRGRVFEGTGDWDLNYGACSGVNVEDYAAYTLDMDEGVVYEGASFRMTRGENGSLMSEKAPVVCTMDKNLIYEESSQNVICNIDEVNVCSLAKPQLTAILYLAGMLTFGGER
ncbi:MAG: hypothetical protein NC211_01105 [Alistipes senegalensis]|nr:hypothetical protein [Oxalobacter formigenes]MCM1280424.1 hypothetical protein [Alistipes senegalensis]